MTSIDDARLRGAWDEVRDFWMRLKAGQARMEDDPQPRLAAELFDSFLAASDADSGRKALETAFMMWGNIGDADAVEAAIQKLDPRADYWGRLLHGANNAFGRRDRQEEFTGLLCHLENVLEHPRARSSLHLLLADRYMDSAPDSAHRHFEQVTRLDVSPGDVQRASSALYSLDHLQVGQPAPLFDARSIDGETIRLADLRGSPVLLDFWESTCGPCYGEFPTLRALRDEFPMLTLIGVSSDRSEEEMRAAIAAEQLAWPHIREEITVDSHVFVFGPLRERYAVWGVPFAFLIDPQGRIAARDLRGDDLLNAVRALAADSR